MLAFVDVRLIVYTPAVLVAGLAAAFLLGNSPQSGKSRIGLAIVLVGAALIVYNQPNRSLDQHRPEVVGRRKLVPTDHPWIASARQVGTSFGD